jgi:hypothetical protein
VLFRKKGFKGNFLAHCLCVIYDTLGTDCRGFHLNRCHRVITKWTLGTLGGTRACFMPTLAKRDITMKISDGHLDLAALPTKTISDGVHKNFAAELAALNPQPLPPKTDLAGKNLDWVTLLNPHPLPPSPPDPPVSSSPANGAHITSFGGGGGGDFGGFGGLIPGGGGGIIGGLIPGGGGGGGGIGGIIGGIVAGGGGGVGVKLEIPEPSNSWWTSDMADGSDDGQGKP